MKISRALFAWLAATIVTAVTGSIAQTQFNLAAISAIGAPVPFAVRLQTTLLDVAGFAPMLAGVTAAGFLVAFVVAAFIGRFWPARQAFLYSLAGAAAIAAALLVMNAMLPVTAIAATRALAGFGALTAAGALGGWVFAALLARRRPRNMA